MNNDALGQCAHMGTRHTHCYSNTCCFAKKCGWAGRFGEGVWEKGTVVQRGMNPMAPTPPLFGAHTPLKKTVPPVTTHTHTHAHTHSSSVHYLFSSHRLNLAMLHSGLGHTLRHVLAASLVLQKQSKHVPESAVACSSSSVWWQNCEWRRTAPTVFMSS